MNRFPASVDRSVDHSRRAGARDAATIARLAARILAADADPSYPARVDALLRRAAGAREHARDPLAAFVLAAAEWGCRAAPASVADERLADAYLRRQLGVDEGMAPDHERILAAIAEALTSDEG